jgi:lambda repressor-like predicted transcriptional regulator
VADVRVAYRFHIDWTALEASTPATITVELMGHYSNQADQGERISQLLQMVPKQQRELTSRTIKQIHRRLSSVQIDELIALYRAGATLRELSKRFEIHRATVSIILERHNVARRYRLLEGERLDGAIQAYKSGESIISIANRLGVAGDTIRKALIKAGVRMRPRRGWPHRPLGS